MTVMPASPPVLIADADVVSYLKTEPGFQRDILVFADNDVGRAVQAIVEHRAALVVLHRNFLATSRGAALVSRIRDSTLSHVEIRVLDEVSDYVDLVARQFEAGLPPGTAVPGEPLPSDYDSLRIAPRFTLRTTLDVRVDGDWARLVDLSRTGAQLLLGLVPVRPRQQVHIHLDDDQQVLRLRADIVWATLESSHGPLASPQYRAGAKFIDVDPGVLDAFCARNRTGAHAIGCEEPLEEPPHVSADGAAVETAPAAGNTDDEAGVEAGENDRTSSQVENDW